MTIFRYAGAPAAPAGPDWATEFSALSNLIGVWEFPSHLVSQSSGEIAAVQSFAQSSGNSPVTFSAEIGKRPLLGQRDGVNCAVLVDGNQMDAPGGLLTTPATLFVVFHVAPGETSGSIFGDLDASGGGMSVLLAGERDTGVELRARISTTFGDKDHATHFGWHAMAVQVDDSDTMTAVFDAVTRVSSLGEQVDFNQLRIGFGFFGGLRMCAVFDAAVIDGPQMDLCERYWRWVRGAAY